MEAQFDHSAVNLAAEGAQVGQQNTYIGRIIHESNTFGPDPDSPDDLFERGRHYLDIDAPREATALIEEALTRGLTRTTEVGYHWQLALLAGRSLDQLSPADLKKVAHARDLGRTGIED